MANFLLKPRLFILALILASAAIAMLLQRHFQSPLPRLDVKDWNDRAELYEGPFTPSLDTVALAAKSEGMVGNMLTLAVFSSPLPPPYTDLATRSPSGIPPKPIRIAIDNYGLVWRVTESDFLALRALAESVYPFASHSWTISVPYTCQPSDYLILPGRIAGELVRCCVHSYAPGRRKLEGLFMMSDGRVHLELPTELDEFMRLVYQRARGTTYGPGISEEGEKVVREVLRTLWPKRS